MTQPPSGRRRFLALAFPFLAADLFRRQEAGRAPDGDWPAEPPPGAASQGPLAFIEKLRGAFRLVALDADALALGLEPGMPLADARARCPDLQAVPHDPAGEAALMARLADACLRFTPMTALDPPEGLVLDIAGCAHLFGGEVGLTAQACALMQGHGLRVRAARADTPEAALALARFAPEEGAAASGRAASEAAAIRALPLIALRCPSDALLALRRAGFTSVGDLADLPPAPLAARFGAGLVDARDRLLGRIDSRIVPRRAPAPIRVERRFAEPVARVETVMAVLGELLEAACVLLAERHEGGRQFALRLERSDGAVRDLAIETGAPVRESAVVLRLFAERIEALADPLDPGFGFDRLCLAVPIAEPLGAAQPALDPAARDPGARDGVAVREGDVAALLDRLGARLGTGRLRRLAPRDTHLPERATRLIPAAQAAAPWPAPEPGEPPLRPLMLLERPERIEVIAQVPDGPPRRFRWRGQAHRIVAQEGPERIADLWWRRPRGHVLAGDGADPGLTRDYYRLEDEAGQRFWVFRHGLYETEAAQPHWYVHGLFA